MVSLSLKPDSDEYVVCILVETNLCFYLFMFLLFLLFLSFSRPHP